MEADERIAREALERLNKLASARDLAFVAEFHPSASILAGSEEGEVASTESEMRDLLASIYALPVRISWQWEKVIANVIGDTAFVFAEGRLVMSGDSGVERKPYRMSGALQRSSDRWRWRLFHGSEPGRP
jgi:ketosteroid isomerase-like protein